MTNNGFKNKNFRHYKKKKPTKTPPILKNIKQYQEIDKN